MHEALTFSNYEHALASSKSQACQDLFVLAATDGLRSGSFLEIGASDGRALSNTYMLEKHFGWRGVSIDLDWKSRLSFLFRARNAHFISGDATQTDYSSLIHNGILQETVDYLSIDIETMTNTLAALKRVLVSGFTFSVITYETDWYDPNTPRQTADDVRAESRELLEGAGYVAVAKDVCASDDLDPFEDWWVYPSRISPSRLETMISVFNERRTGPQLLGIET